MAPYQYKQLDSSIDEIRLVKLFPGEYSQPLCVSIIHAALREPEEIPSKLLSVSDLASTLPDGWAIRQTLDGRYIFSRGSHVDPPDVSSWKHPVQSFDAARYDGFLNDPDPNFEPAYDALSYVWGSQGNMQPLVIRDKDRITGNEAECTISITGNLSTALKHLRDVSEVRTLWIDALCINQVDITERNEQVLRMGRIYRLARRVVVWLGEQDDDSDLAMSTVDHLGQQLEYSIDHYLIKHPEAEFDDWYIPDTPLPYDERTWQALDKLFKRPWFERLWVVQEVGLANRLAVVQCGKYTISWSSFRRAVTLLDDKAVPIQSLQDSLNNVALFTGEISWSMKRLLMIAREKKCSDPRDKLYGILSIAPRNVTVNIQPNYALAPADIFKDAVLKFLQASTRLTMLRFGTQDRTSGLPSWAPDWTSSSPITTMFGEYYTSATSGAEYILLTPNTLSVTGLQVATVAAVAEVVIGDSRQLFDYLEQQNLLLASVDPYVTGGNKGDALVSTMIQDRTKSLYPNHAYPSKEEWKRFLSSSESSERRQVWMSRQNRWLQGRSFIQTNEGYFVLGPAWVEPGDVIVVLLGCQVPIVLRPSATVSGAAYEVIGECYVQGLMFGEALLGQLDEGTRVTIDLDDVGSYVYSFARSGSQGETLALHEDPRLGPLPEDWEPIVASKRTSDEPAVKYRHKRTGGELNSDPRLRSEALIERGVLLRKFDLV